MFSLEKFVDEQMNFFGDVLDKRPSQVSRSAKDPLLLVIDDNLPLKTKVEQLINSELASQKVWAITNIARLVANRIECLGLIKQIPQHFLSKSAKVELAAAKTAYALLYHDANSYTSIFIDPVINRFVAIPAIEYAQCIEKMAPAITSANINSNIVPLIHKLFEQDTKHQYAGCAILKFVPIEPLKYTKEDFYKLLDSEVFVNQHLIEISKRFVSVFGEDWLLKELPERICSLGPPFHAGIAAFFVDLMDSIRSAELHSTLRSIFEWSTQSEEIAILILKNSENIIKSRFVDYHGKVYQVLPFIISSNNVTIRAEIPKILANNPQILSATETIMRNVFTSLGNDADPAVKISFLENIETIYRNTPSPKLQEFLVNTYLTLFTDSNMRVLEKLINPFMLATLVKSRPPPIMTSVVSLADKFKLRWRYFSSILRTMEQFPPDSLIYNLKNFLGMMEEAIAKNPQSLMPSAISFYVCVIRHDFKQLKLHDFMRYFSVKFSGSDFYQMRIVFLKLATALLIELPNDVYNEEIWPMILSYKKEKTLFVQAKLFEYLIQYAKLKKAMDTPKVSADCNTFLQAYNNVKDPYVLEVMQNLKTYVLPPRAMSVEELNKVPAMITKTSPRLLRPSNSSKQANHGNLKLPPRPVISQRNPSPKVTPRSSKLSPMTKSVSNSNIQGLNGRFNK